MCVKILCYRKNIIKKFEFIFRSVRPDWSWAYLCRHPSCLRQDSASNWKQKVAYFYPKCEISNGSCLSLYSFSLNYHKTYCWHHSVLYLLSFIASVLVYQISQTQKVHLIFPLEQSYRHQIHRLLILIIIFVFLLQARCLEKLFE